MLSLEFMPPLIPIEVFPDERGLSVAEGILLVHEAKGCSSKFTYGKTTFTSKDRKETRLNWRVSGRGTHVRIAAWPDTGDLSAVTPCQVRGRADPRQG